MIIFGDHAITVQKLTSLGVDEDRAKLFFKNNEYQEFSRGDISENDFCSALRGYLGCELDNETLKSAHNDHINKVDEKVIAVLDSLKDGGQAIAFATDTNLWQTERERELVDLARYSPNIFRSHELHLLKNEQSYFPVIQERLSVPFESMLLIDDSASKIANAELSGLKTHLFTSADNLRKDSNVEPFIPKIPVPFNFPKMR